jgi:phosphoglycerate dehydrogenase-like enzyme
MEIPAMTKIGLSSDLFDTKGRPVFDPVSFDLFTEAGLSWTVLPPDGGTIDPASVAGYDALFIGGSRLTEASLASDSGVLRVVARNGVGFDALDLQALTRRGILLTNTPLAVRHSVATIALAFILALSLRIPLKSRLAREGRWAERGDFPGVGLPGRTLGIVGLGGIGRELVRLAQPFGMRVIGADPFVTRDQLSETSVELLPLEEVLAQSDFVVIACLLDQTTRHLIDAPRIALMKPTAFIINVARGPIIEEAALIDALSAGALAGAGLDVFEQEPPDRNNPLFSLENVIATPHSLCWTDTFLAGVARSAIKSIVDAVEGRLPEHIVNRAAIDHPRVKQWLASASAGG